MSRTIELATILLTDLVDSTSTAARLGPTGADQHRDAYFAVLRGAFRQFGGREFKNSGDGLWASFSSASAAVSCAVHIQQELEQRHRADAERPHVRIGLSAGECTVDDGDYFGMPAIETARLCDRAPADGVLVSPAVRLLAGRCEGVAFTSVGELELKGLPAPMEAFTLAWQPRPEPVADASPSATTELPLQGAIATAGAVQFVGRAAERHVLVDAFTAAAKRERRVVLVSGEAGMGKTSLITDFARQAHADGAVVLYGRCEEGLAIPYRPWVELLGHLIDHASADDLDRVPASDLAELGRLVPGLHDRLHTLAPPSGSIADKYLLFGAVARLVTSVAGDRTLVVVLDDLHWADTETLQLLQHVVSSWASASVLVLGTYRHTDVDADHPLTEATALLHRTDGFETVGLKGMSAQEVTSLLAEVVGHEVDDEETGLAHALWNETSGSPFFVVEVVRHLAEAGTIVQQDDGRWVAATDLTTLELPMSVRAVIGQRVRRLGERSRQVLNAAAVVGREFEGATLAAALEIDDDEVLAVLEQATAAGLVAETGQADRFTFPHALVQHALYSELSMTRRARLHLQVADAIEASMAHGSEERAGELANHLFAATLPAQQDRAVRLAMRAGDGAIRSAAPGEAVRWFQQALDSHGTGGRLGAQILLSLGSAELLAGRAGYRERLLEAARVARGCDCSELFVAAAIANYRGFHSTSGAIDEERVDVLEEALDLVGPQDSPERARLLATLAGELAHSGQERRFDLCREATEIARRLGDPAVLLDAMLRTGSAMNVPPLYDERRARTEEILRLSAEHGDPFQRFFAIEMHADSLLARGEIAEVRRLHEERRRIAEELRQPVLTWVATNASGLLQLLSGDVEGAEELADEAFAIGVETGQPDVMVYYGALIIPCRIQRGRAGEMIPVLEQAVADNPGLPAFRVVLAMCLALDGRLDEGRVVFAELRESGFPFDLDLVWMTDHVTAADVAVLLGDRESATLLYDRLAPFGDLVACTRANCLGSAAYSLGTLAELLGRSEDAERHLRVALETNDRLGSPYHLARTQTALARVLRERDPARSHELAAAALEIGERLQLPLVTHHARALLGPGGR